MPDAARYVVDCEKNSAQPSRRRDCHFADALSPSLLKHPLKVEGGAAERQNSRRWLAQPCVLTTAVLFQLSPESIDFHNFGVSEVQDFPESAPKYVTPACCQQLQP